MQQETWASRRKAERSLGVDVVFLSIKETTSCLHGVGVSVLGLEVGHANTRVKKEVNTNLSGELVCFLPPKLPPLSLPFFLSMYP